MAFGGSCFILLFIYELEVSLGGYQLLSSQSYQSWIAYFDSGRFAGAFEATRFLGVYWIGATSVPCSGLRNRFSNASHHCAGPIGSDIILTAFIG